MATGNESRDKNICGLYAKGIFLDLIKGQFRTFVVHDAKWIHLINLLPEAFARSRKGDDLFDFISTIFLQKGIKSSILVTLFRLLSTMCLMSKEMPSSPA